MRQAWCSPGITKGQTANYTLSDRKKIQKVTEVVTGTESVVREVSCCSALHAFSSTKLQRIKLMRWATVSFVILVFVSGCSSPRPYRSADTAVLKGEIREALAIFELQAKEAEKNARISWWPREHFATASWAYAEASKVALYSGQLQKAVTYGEKALEMAESIKEVVPSLDPPRGTDSQRSGSRSGVGRPVTNQGSGATTICDSCSPSHAAHQLNVEFATM